MFHVFPKVFKKINIYTIISLANALIQMLQYDSYLETETAKQSSEVVQPLWLDFFT